jgi:hypothetical protein
MRKFAVRGYIDDYIIPLKNYKLNSYVSFEKRKTNQGTLKTSVKKKTAYIIRVNIGLKSRVDSGFIKPKILFFACILSYNLLKLKNSYI